MNPRTIPITLQAPSRQRKREAPKGRARRRRGARCGARAARRRAAPARPADRAPAPAPGSLRPAVGRPPRGARGRDEPGADRGLRGRHLLSPLRRGQGRRGGAGRADGARLRRPVVRDGRRARPAAAPAGDPGPGRARHRGAVHRPLRTGAGGGGRPACGGARHLRIGARVGPGGGQRRRAGTEQRRLRRPCRLRGRRAATACSGSASPASSRSKW